MYEVQFRGENETTMRAWKPNDADQFECELTDVGNRFERLVHAGVLGELIDGVVPYVVAVVEVQYRVRDGEERRLSDVKHWQYAEPDAIPGGPWAQHASHDNFALSGIAVENIN